MAETTFGKSARNRALPPQGRSPTNTRESWTFRVDIEASDAALLRSFFQQEVNFFNTLVEGFSARLRSFPEALLTLTGPWEDLFVDLAAHHIDIRRLPSKAEQLPTILERHKRTLYDEKGAWRPIPERTTMMFELAAAQGGIHPLARQAMAREMVRFYRQQAQTSLASVPAPLRSEQVYRTPPEVLEAVDVQRKRHVQLPRDAIVMRYDEPTQRTIFHTPYTKRPIEVAGDYTNPQSWNVMVIRQAVIDRSTKRAVWQIELRKSPNGYFLKLLDSHNPYQNSAFNVGKSARSAV